MARVKKGNACETSRTPGQLAGVRARLIQNDPDYTFEEAQNDIDIIFSEWVQNKTTTSFEELLINAELDGYGFEYNSNIGKKDKQIRIKRLDKENTALFRYRDTALNKINGIFSRQTFQHLFVNRSVSHSGKRYIVTPTDFNNGVITFKNTLAKTIIDGLGIDWQYSTEFFTKTGAAMNNGLYLIDLLFNSPKVSGKDGILKRLDVILDDPITYSKELNIIEALYALNNFDHLLETELQGLIRIQPGNKGLLNNTFYTPEVKGKSTEYWASDTHEDKALSKYTSNLARFVVKQIPKVVKTDRGYRHIEGKYLNPNELYVLSSAIKQAEFEYYLLHPDNPVVLAVDQVEGIRTLISNRYDLPALRNAKTELIDSLIAFLWDGTNSDFSISKIYHEEIKLNPKALDIESLLGFEIYQSSTPTYIEYDNQGTLTTKNYGGVYKSGNSLKWGITEFIFTSLQSKLNPFGKTIIDELKSGSLSQESKEKVINILLYDVLGFDMEYNEAAVEFAKNNEEDLIKLAKLISRAISNPSAEIKNAVSNGDASAYRAIENHVSQVLLSRNATFNGKPCAINSSFFDNYNQVISDSVVTQFDSNSGATIPVYRLNSSFTHMTWFLHQYQTTQTGKGQNLLADYPNLLYKYNSEGELNKKYKGYANYVLGFGNGDDVVNFNEMTAADQMHIMMLTNLQSKEDGIFYFQPACYSDKVSIGLVALNLKELIKLTGSGKIITAEDLIDPFDVQGSIARIREMDFQYRRNSLSATVNSILDKWNRFFKSDAYDASKEEKNEIEKNISPIDKETLSQMFSVSGSDYQAHSILLNKLKKLQEYLSKLDKKHLKKAVLWGSSPKEDVDFIDQLDYVVDKNTKKLGVNQSLLQDFIDLSDFETFNTRQEDVLTETLLSDEYSDMISSMKQKLSSSTKDDPYFKLLIGNQMKASELKETGATKESPKYFERKWDSLKGKKGGYDVRLVQNPDGTVPFDEMFKLQAALANLGRFAFLDLVSKSYYLDPPKGKYSNGHEESARRIDSMAKRMVLYPATIQAFQQGRIDGVSQTIRVSAIEDASEEVWNPQGDSHGQDIFDGSGLESPWHSRMEDNSIPGHGIKGTKKTLGTSTLGQNSTLFKWAGFPITNEKMRNSLTGKYNLHRMFYKMNNIVWDEDVDITKGYLGNDLSIPSTLVDKPIYISSGLQYYNLVNIIKEPGASNTYTITKIECDSKGVKLKDASGNFIIVKEQGVKIDTIYSLWEALGGLNSMELENGQLEPSELSIDATFQYIVNVGTVKDAKATHFSQKNVRQPLRDKFIAIAASKSALKRGAANINTSKDAWESDESLASFKVNTSSFGIQLDANHHADLSDVREMSQTISTLASGGNTSMIAQQAYKSIGDLVQLSLKKVSSYLKLAEKKGIQKSIEAISERLIKRLATETKINSTDFIEQFATDLETVILPISDRRFYKIFVKEIIEDLNKSSIKRRYSGLGGILNPASNIFQIYTIGDNTYTFTTLLKIAKRELAKDPKITTALQKFFLDKKNLIITNQQQGQLSFKQDKDGKNNDIDIVNFYLAYKYGNYSSIEEIIEKVLREGEPITKPIENMHSIWAEIQILDTIRYRKKTTDPWTQITLDSRQTLNNFVNVLSSSLNSETGDFDLQVELVLSTPHDLRPQIAVWTSKQNIGMKQVDVVETSFTSTFARFASTTKDSPFESESINNVTSDLVKQGEEIMENCK